jgi:hypothetical protein
MTQTPGNTEDQIKALLGVLSLLRIALSQLQAPVQAIERVFEGTPELAERYNRELEAAQRDPRPSIDIAQEIEMLRRLLLG